MPHYAAKNEIFSIYFAACRRQNRYFVCHCFTLVCLACYRTRLNIERWTYIICFDTNNTDSDRLMEVYIQQWTNNPKWNDAKTLSRERKHYEYHRNANYLPGIIIIASICHVLEMFSCRSLFSSCTVDCLPLPLFRFPPLTLTHLRVHKHTHCKRVPPKWMGGKKRQ